jgi:hypothetical protein
MRANELRIGNYVKANKLACNEKEGNTLTVCGIGLDVDLTNGTTQNYIGIDGILLTKEWLLKFGFSKKDNSSYYYPKGVWHRYVFGYTKFRLPYLNLEPEGGIVPHATCNYVHQLQNLYFALTNKELTIN